MASNPHGQCRACRFWHPVTDEESACGPSEIFLNINYPGKDSKGYILAGECHRRAPTAFRQADGMNWPEYAQAVWPITLPLDWCGDFTPGTDTP